MAKSKNKPARRKQKSSKPIANPAGDADPVSAAQQSDQAPATADNSEPSIPLAPVIRRPLLFTISLVAFVGWLVYLAYIAYIVLA